MCVPCSQCVRATLLLAHARDQTLNQRRLETYLATSAAPSLDLSGRLSNSQSPRPRSSQRRQSPATGTSGANTPRDLNARVKILELYTLHVLLRNDEWEYAREFITMSSVLDDERRDAFLQALASLQAEQEEEQKRQREERELQEEKLRQEVEEARRLRAENVARERRRLEEERARREGSEVDYGVEQTPSAASFSHRRPSGLQPHASSRPSPPSAMARPNGKTVVPPPPSLTARANLLIARLRAIVDQLSATLRSNPVFLMRFLVFVVGLVFVLGHRGIRDRVRRMLGASWSKVKATGGMGTKVSYI